MIIDSHAHVIEHLSGMGARGEVRPIGDGRVRFLDGEEMQVIPGDAVDSVISTIVEII